MIQGPSRTPYEDGLFFFDVQLPSDYPNSPPAFFYVSYCSDRLNPNLYEDGKVCVSLLGTWTGKVLRRVFVFVLFLLSMTPRAGSGVVRIDPLHFLAGCRTRRLNQAWSVLGVHSTCSRQVNEPGFEPRSWCCPSKYCNHTATEVDQLAGLLRPSSTSTSGMLPTWERLKARITTFGAYNRLQGTWHLGVIEILDPKEQRLRLQGQKTNVHGFRCLNPLLVPFCSDNWQNTAHKNSVTKA